MSWRVFSFLSGQLSEVLQLAVMEACTRTGRSQGCRRKVMEQQCCPPTPVVWGRGDTAYCQHCCAATLCYGCPAAQFSLLPGHLGNSLKQSISVSGEVKDGEETSFAHWSFWVLCVLPAFADAAFSAAADGQEQQL